MEQSKAEKEKLKKQINASNFVKNNGVVLTTINILRHRYTTLSAIESVFTSRGITRSELLDCINFLNEGRYIHLREITSKNEVNFADIDYELLEVKLAEKGIRILNGGIHDNMIEV